MVKNHCSKFFLISLFLLLFYTFPAAASKISVVDTNLDYSYIDNPYSDTIVVLETGYGAGTEVWKNLPDLLSVDYDVFMYSRAGLGDSSDTELPKNSFYQAVILKQILDKVFGHHYTVILVAHSLGGITARIFTSLYPEKVDGALFMDCSHEKMLKRMEELDPEFYKEYIKQITGEGTVEDVQTSLHYVEILPNKLTDKPLYILSADTGIYPDKLNFFAGTWNELQKSFIKLSQFSEQKTLKGSNHQLFLQYPEEVVKAVDWIVEQLYILEEE